MVFIESVTRITNQIHIAAYHPSLMSSNCSIKRICAWFPLAERLWLSPGSVLGGHPNGHLLLHGSAMVRRRHRHLHCPHRLAEDGERVERSRRAASVPRGQVGQAATGNITVWQKHCYKSFVFDIERSLMKLVWQSLVYMSSMSNIQRAKNHRHFGVCSHWSLHLPRTNT